MRTLISLLLLTGCLAENTPVTTPVEYAGVSVRLVAVVEHIQIYATTDSTAHVVCYTATTANGIGLSCVKLSP